MRQAAMLDGRRSVRHHHCVEDGGKPSAAGAARVAIVAITVWVAIEVLVIVACLDYVAGGGFDVWFATSSVVALAMVTDFAMLLIVGIFVLIWFYRAMAVAHRLTPGLSISPAGAVGWFFVPVASLWKPYEAMVQIVEGSSATAERGAAVRHLVFWWWGAWIGRSLAGVFLQFLPADGPIPPGMAVVMIVFAMLGIAAAMVLRMLIRGVTRLQDSYIDASIFD